MTTPTPVDQFERLGKALEVAMAYEIPRQVKHLQQGTTPGSLVRPGSALDRILKSIAEANRRQRQSDAEIEVSQKAHNERMAERYPWY